MSCTLCDVTEAVGHTMHVRATVQHDSATCSGVHCAVTVCDTTLSATSNGIHCMLAATFLADDSLI
jgi:hypothetical protein